MNKWRFMEYLEKNGYTQRSLALELGMSKNTINNKLNGRGCFDTDEIQRICELLCINDGHAKAEIFLT